MSGSRYDDLGEYVVPGPDGSAVRVLRTPHRERPERLGVHLRRDGERLDHLAWRYLRDATEFWRICDVNNALLPDSLTEVRRVDIPGEQR